jgi:hypothetical protein
MISSSLNGGPIARVGPRQAVVVSTLSSQETVFPSLRAAFLGSKLGVLDDHYF